MNTTSEFVRHFGLNLAKSKKEQTEKLRQAVVPIHDEGAVVYDTEMDGNQSGFMMFGQMFDSELRTSKDKINFYRLMCLNPYVDEAINNIINEAINVDEDGDTITLNLDKSDFSANIKKRINEEFNEIMKLLNFNFRGSELFTSFYVDGQLYAHLIVDSDQVSEGVKEIRLIDPRTVQKFVQITRDENGMEVAKKTFFLYFPQALETFGNLGAQRENRTRQRFSNKTLRDQVIVLNADSISNVWSGKCDISGVPISYLEYAIKPYNQINSLEDAILVYRLSRAPEKRAFYIDVGELSRTKAEQYIKNMIDKYKNKATYNVATGKLDNNSQITSMFHDYWIPRKNGRTTDIQTVGGTSSNFADPGELDYFLKKLYRSLKIPLTRMSVESTQSYTKGSEITRDELKFQKFINNLRARFSEFFSQILRIQLLVKNVITQEEWETNKYFIRYKYSQDSMLFELKQAELLDMRIDALERIKDYIGPKTNKTGFYSKEWVFKNILHRTDEQIADIENQQDKEDKQGLYKDHEYAADPDSADPGPEKSAPQAAQSSDEFDATTPNKYDIDRGD